MRALPPAPAAAPSGRLLGGTPVRQGPSIARLTRRRWLVVWTKRLLPVLALALLASIALWPEIDRTADQGRIAFRRFGAGDAGAARLLDPRYQSVDAKGRPYTLTANSGLQVGPERVNLVEPKGDVTLENGSWLMVQAHDGVYMQHSGQLDLAGDVTLYRADGLTMITDAASLDMKAGAATSSARTHAEGPFGTLDAQGFALVDKGAVTQFTGPARLVLNPGPGSGAPAPQPRGAGR